MSLRGSVRFVFFLCFLTACWIPCGRMDGTSADARGCGRPSSSSQNDPLLPPMLLTPPPASRHPPFNGGRCRIGCRRPMGSLSVGEWTQSHPSPSGCGIVAARQPSPPDARRRSRRRHNPPSPHLPPRSKPGTRDRTMAAVGRAELRGGTTDAMDALFESQRIT